MKQKQQVSRLKKNSNNLTNLDEVEGEDEDDLTNLNQDEEGLVRGIQLSQPIDGTLATSSMHSSVGASKKHFATAEIDAYNYR